MFLYVQVCGRLGVGHVEQMRCCLEPHRLCLHLHAAQVRGNWACEWGVNCSAFTGHPQRVDFRIRILRCCWGRKMLWQESSREKILLCSEVCSQPWPSAHWCSLSGTKWSLKQGVSGCLQQLTPSCLRTQKDFVDAALLHAGSGRGKVKLGRSRNDIQFLIHPPGVCVSAVQLSWKGRNRNLMRSAIAIDQDVKGVKWKREEFPLRNLQTCLVWSFPACLDLAVLSWPQRGLYSMNHYCYLTSLAFL